MESHLITLLRCSFFQAPKVTEVRPVTIPPHTELVEIITDGQIRFEIDGEEQVFSRGACFWHREGEQTVCKTFPEAPYRCLALNFTVRDSRRPGPRISTWNDPNEAVTFARECHRAFHSASTDHDALALYAYATIRWQAFTSTVANPPQCPQLLLNACDFMEQNLHKDLTPDSIARQVGVSKPYLFALFKKHFNKAPVHFLQEQRISRAKELLTSAGNSAIKEIALSCGFSELEVFYRQFKRQVGITPAAYRSKYSVRINQ